MPGAGGERTENTSPFSLGYTRDGGPSMKARRRPLLWSLSLGSLAFVAGTGIASADDLAGCMQAVTAKGPAKPEVVSFNVKHDRGQPRKGAIRPSGTGWERGVVRVSGVCVFYYKAGQRTPTSVNECFSDSLIPRPDPTAEPPELSQQELRLNLFLWPPAGRKGPPSARVFRLLPDPESLTAKGLRNGIAAACGAQQNRKVLEECSKSPSGCVSIADPGPIDPNQ